MRQVALCVILILAAASCGDGGAESADAGASDDASTTPVCPSGQELCGAACANINSDGLHCGTCDNACDPGQVCNGAGVCELTCQEGLLDCNGTCIDPDSNPTFCGASTDCLDANVGTTCTEGQACTGGVCLEIQGAQCSEIVTNMDVWGRVAQGIDLRSFTGSTLHWIGCVEESGSCAPATFYCDVTDGVLTFGTTATIGSLRAQVDPGDANGDAITGNSSSCCSTADPSAICNSINVDSNGTGLDAVTALCRSLGYSSGTVVREVDTNACPEPHSLDVNGGSWSSDFVNSSGYGAEYRCSQ